MNKRAFLIASAGLLTAGGGSDLNAAGTTGNETNRIAASGTFAPAGPPIAPPVRTAAGGRCIVDIKQPYTISGALSGTLEIDYRILVDGPCGPPAGTFDENWIAFGKFSGAVNGQNASAKFTYVAHVKAGGDVAGQIKLGEGLVGELGVRGDFGDGHLSYEGWLEF